MRRPLALLALLLGLAIPGCTPDRHLIGALHEHSGYSDGYPGSRPADYFAAARDPHHLNFLGSGEHSSNADLPMTLNEECVNPLVAPQCLIADQVNPLDSLRKWDATLEQANAATDPAKDFVGFRGFEWTSDRMGHINVYFSKEDSKPEEDGGSVAIERFYRWLARTGSDGVATFNHPGDKSLCGQLGCEETSDPAFNWEDFRYFPWVDGQMVGIEVFNGGSDFGSAPGHHAPPEGWYSYALDKGWHVGAIGAEDKGHRRGDDWGGPSYAKTVVLAPKNTAAAIKNALKERHYYAVLDNQLRLEFSVDAAGMGARIQRAAGRSLPILAMVSGSSTPLTLELVTSGGRVVATATGDKLTTTRAVSGGERWYFLRVRRSGQPVAYSSPIWVNSPIPPAGRGPDPVPVNRGGWLAGDLHVHTCYSHDAWCEGIDPPSEREPGLDGLTVEERFKEADQRGLDYLAISDHNDVRSVDDPGFGTHGVLGVRGYENSLRGHAQMLGVPSVLDKADSSAAAVNLMASRARAVGGVFQINHPGDDVEVPFVGCDATPLHWQYGFHVRPDTIELLNPTSPASVAEQYLECWLNRGAHVGVTGGSDAHLRLLTAAGVGHPTTWALASTPTERGVLDALRAGRTTVSGLPPSAGGAPLLIEHDGNRDGAYVQAIGTTVKPGTPMRVRSLDPLASGIMRVRANGVTLLDKPLVAGQAIDFTAPLLPGWIRAVLRLEPGVLEPTAICGPPWQAIVLCAYDRGIVGMTSPVYVAP
jgi:hypothetical protein